MAQFTPNSSLRPGASPESDWAYLLGSLAWTDHIVFTKESLVEFLKSKDLQVSPSFKELSQLPKYATVGKFDRDPASAAGAEPAAAPAQPSNRTELRATIQPLPGVVDASGKPYRPAYKVTEPMGGGSAAVSALFAPLEDDEGVGARPPRRAPAPPAAAAAPEAEQQQQQQQQARSASGTLGDTGYRPTTRVTMPGGTGGASSITLG
ncbi:hypothetical protein OC834_004114 [Tilletia horrida]|nr:hypothetical protein OC834_004114 [Tilletia horrida]